MLRYFIGFIVTIGLIVLLVILLLGGGGNNSSNKSKVSSQPLASYANTDAVAKLTIDGPINYQSQHEQVQISVDSDQVLYQQIQGYDGSVVNQQSYPNTQNAYTNFLSALAAAGFTKGNTSSALKSEQGYCPTDRRYVYELNQDGKDIERFWSTSCGIHSYNGNADLTISLFEAQVPNYDSLTNNFNL